MASTAATATMFNCPNYVGEVFEVGKKRTPFLNMIGGLTGGGKQYSTLLHPVAQPWSLDAGSQPAISETTSTTAPTASTYARALDTNTVQIFQQTVSVTYVKQATTQLVQADAVNADAMLGTQPILSETDFQIMANLKQISTDVDWSMLQGTFAQATSSAVAPKMRGIITATTTNAVAAASATLSKGLFEELIQDMATNGAIWEDPVILVNAFQLRKLNDLYGYAPESRTVGGVSVNQIVTNYAEIGVVWAPNMPTDTLLIAEMSTCYPVFCPVPGKGLLFYEELSKTGASESGQVFGMIGLDYGPEEYHGKITGLATS